jgi:hypothetical protein
MIVPIFVEHHADSAGRCFSHILLLVQHAGCARSDRPHVLMISQTRRNAPDLVVVRMDKSASKFLKENGRLLKLLSKWLG